MPDAIGPGGMRELTPLRATALYICFFLSGVAGLIYEVLWAKYLALYVGSTGMAQVIVLATFMGGLALGSEVLGRKADRVRSPLRMFAFLQFGIGVYALVFDRIFDFGRWAFILTARFSGITPGGLVAGKILACVLTILLPTFLMGGTLPALGRHMIRTMSGVGPKISRLYFLNSFGAVFGCLLAGFYLIQTYGLQFSMVAGGAINLAVGLIALAVLTRERQDERYFVEAARVEARIHAEAPLPRWAVAAILISVSVSGGVSMMYEVAWIRLLTLVLGSSTYSFSLMLATFILGLSIGSFLLSLRRKQTGYTVIFGLSEAAVGLTVLLMLPFYVKLPYWFNQLASSLAREPATFGLYQFCTFIMCALVMFIPTILQGITLPAAIKVITLDIRRLGHRVGYVYAINTLGTLIGSVGAGFAGLPLLGIKGTLELAVALNGILALVVLTTERERRWRLRSLGIAVLATLVVWGWYSVGMQSWNRQVLTAGVYRTRERIPSYGALLKAIAKHNTVFYRDGIDATISVEDVQKKEPERLLVVNGKADATTRTDMPTQKLLAHLPMLIHPDPQKVFIVGIGSGATIGSVLAYGGARHVDVVELSRDIIDASRLFEEVNGRYWEDPRVRVHWEDAKTFLQVTDDRYDVIISEPTNPWIAGIAGVFSREYFETCRDHLAKGGFFVQWIQAYELEDATFFMMLETFSSVFPFYTLWNPTRSDTVLVGSVSPYAPDFARMERRLSAPEVQQDVNTVQLSRMLTLLSLQMADRARQPSHVSWFGVHHSDFFPILEYVAPRGFFIGSSAGGAKWIDVRNQSPSNSPLWVHEYLKQHTPTAAELRECHRFYLESGWVLHNAPRTWALEWADRFPKDSDALIAMALAMPTTHAQTIPVVHAANDARARKLACRMKFEDYISTRTFLSDAGAWAALDMLEDTLSDESFARDPDLHRWIGELKYDLGMYDAAAAHLHAAAQLYRQMPGREFDSQDAGILLCETLLAGGRIDDAAGAYKSTLGRFDADLKVRLVRSRIEAELDR